MHEIKGKTDFLHLDKKAAKRCSSPCFGLMPDLKLHMLWLTTNITSSFKNESNPSLTQCWVFWVLFVVSFQDGPPDTNVRFYYKLDNAGHLDAMMKPLDCQVLSIERRHIHCKIKKTVFQAESAKGGSRQAEMCQELTK